MGVFVSKEAWDVFQHDISRFHNANRSNCLWPHISVIVLPFSPTGNAERLARESCRDDINQALICFGVPLIVEHADIGEDGGFVEDLVLDSLGDNFLAVSIDFDISNSLPSE